MQCKAKKIQYLPTAGPRMNRYDDLPLPMIQEKAAFPQIGET